MVKGREKNKEYENVPGANVRERDNIKAVRII
jgi:hypothetical protein